MVYGLIKILDSALVKFVNMRIVFIDIRERELRG